MSSINPEIQGIPWNAAWTPPPPNPSSNSAKPSPVVSRMAPARSNGDQRLPMGKSGRKSWKPPPRALRREEEEAAVVEGGNGSEIPLGRSRILTRLRSTRCEHERLRGIPWSSGSSSCLFQPSKWESRCSELKRASSRTPGSSLSR